MYLFNLFNKLYLGDSGSYILGLIFSFIVISFYKLDQLVSPYYIILLLWYPCFENLFSILRKFRFNKSPLYPDQNHFHQLLFFFIKKKINGSNLLFDPFISNNVLAKNIDVTKIKADYILISHGHDVTGYVLNPDLGSSAGFPCKSVYGLLNSAVGSDALVKSWDDIKKAEKAAKVAAAPAPAAAG